MALLKRLIEVTVKLAPNTGTNQPTTFTGTGATNSTLSGFRTTVRIENSGAPAGSKANVSIYGMTLDMMNQLSTLGMVYSLVPRNEIAISVGDAENGLSLVFGGIIIQAWGDFNASPDVPFHFECQTGAADAVIPTAASSYTGATDVGTIMASLAKKMNLGFENNGVEIKLSNPYLAGSALTQMKRVAEHAGINAEIINGTTLAIWPNGGSRGGQAPLVSPATGMIGYPSYTQQGIMVRTVFNPNIGFGGQVQVESILKPACGTWNVYKLDHALDSLVPRGLWQSTVYGYNPKYPQPVPQKAAP